MTAAVLPALDASTLAGLVNTGPALAPVVCRVLAGLSANERIALRDWCLRRAVGLHPDQGLGLKFYTFTLIARMQAMESVEIAYLDLGLLDGCAAAAVLVNGRRVPSFSTIRRAIGSAISKTSQFESRTRSPGRPDQPKG